MKQIAFELTPDVIFDTENRTIYDVVVASRSHPNAGAELLKYSNQTPNSFLKNNKSFIRLNKSDALKIYESQFLSGWQSVSEKDYNYALAVLPPLRFTQRNGVEFFVMSEACAARVNSFYAAYKDRYFMRNALYSHSGADIEREIKGMVDYALVKYA